MGGDAEGRGPLGLIAGEGGLPGLIALGARGQGRPVVLVGLEGLAESGLRDLSVRHAWLNPGKVGAIVGFLKAEGVREVVLAGKVPKSLLFSWRGGLRPDMKALGVLMRLRDFRDDTILGAVDRALEAEGLRVVGVQEVCPEILTPEGALTRRKPLKRQREDIEFGVRMALGVGALDIGQTVVVKDRAVLAVEAIEGTDEAIRRGGALSGGGGGVVVKMKRPGQDARFDLPAVGLGTLEAMSGAGLDALALEAGGSIVVGMGEFIARADALGMVVVGVAGRSGT